MTAPAQYIIMKASRMPNKAIAQVGDAYSGVSCDDAGIQSEKVYTDLTKAATAALALKSVNPVGFRIWHVGEAFPIATTERDDEYLGRPIPHIMDKRRY